MAGTTVGPGGTGEEAATDRLRDIEALTDAGLAHLPVGELLDELLDRTLGVLGADTAAVLLLDTSGEQLVATAARGLEDEVYQAARIPLGRGFAGRIAATKQPVVIDDVATADVVNPVLLESGLKSLLGVPLLVAGRLLGVLHVGTLTPRRFADADVELLRMVADRVALATHASLSEAERTAAVALQRSLLPDRLPDVAGLEAALRYSAGGEGDVGGDWYDMFVLPSRWVCITIGDVVGRGLRAAVIMSRIRTTLRAYAIASPPDPTTILERVDTKLRHFEPGEMATAIVALLEPSLERMHVSVAGHPAPVVADPDGGPATYLAVAVDPPLGVAHARRRPATTVDLPPGTVVTFYTDGLVERRRVPLADRMRALCAAVSADGPERVCIRVMAEMVGREAPVDDVAVLVVRRAVHAPAAPLTMTVPAVATSLGDVRAALRRWLAEVGATPEEVVNLLLATGEAASNAVEHAYGPEGGDIVVRARLDGPVAEVAVADRGRWRAARGENRGRGTGLMHAASDDVRVDRTDQGTTVLLRRRLGKRSAP
jgi:anti-sigma regulatory factor (Ser/Thr protein kinase)/putative methionine-R-sulfoxide reductase with GAF domain